MSLLSNSCQHCFPVSALPLLLGNGDVSLHGSRLEKKFSTNTIQLPKRRDKDRTAKVRARRHHLFYSL
jgi:hypothetical protein